MIRGRGERRGEVFRIIGRDPDSTRRSFCPPSRIVASEIRERFGGSSALGEREECACLGWLEDKSWPRGGGRGSADMEKLPLGVSLAKAVADNGGESVLRKRLVAWNNGYLMRTGCTGNRWRVTSEKREWTWSPLSSSLFFSRDVSVILARQIIHWGKSRSTRNERDDTNAGQGRGGRWSGSGRRGGWRGGSKVGMRMMFPLQRWPLRIFVWYWDVCWEERVFNREAWKGKYGGFDENGTVSYLGYVDL